MILCDDKNLLNKKLFLLSEAVHDRFFTFKLTLTSEMFLLLIINQIGNHLRPTCFSMIRGV